MSGWPRLPLRRLGAIVGGGTPTADEENWNGDVPFVTPPDLRPVVGKYIRHTERTLTVAGASSGSATIPGRSVILSIRAPIGYVATTAMPVAFNQGCRALVPDDDTDPRFVAYALMAAAPELGAAGRGTTFLEISAAQMSAFEIAVPAHAVQINVADYLDRETSQIDTLIAKQEQLITTLRERRSAVATHLVLGEARGAHRSGWETRPLRYWMTNRDSERIPLSAEERGARPGKYDYYGASGAIDQIDGYLFDMPLVLVGEDGANLLLRSSPLAFVARGKYWVNNHAHILDPNSGCAEYWAERLEAIDYAPLVTGSAQPKLTAAALMAMRVSAPASPEEQRRIATEVSTQTRDIDALIAKAERFIDLSKERRAALITAAVTGQLEIPTST